MATLDELDYRLRVVEGGLSSSQTQVDNLADDVHNLGTRMDSAETKLDNHEQRIQTLEVKVENHEQRLLLIEQSHINYKVSRNVKYPKSSQIYTLDRCLSAASILALPSVPLLHWQADGRMISLTGSAR